MGTRADRHSIAASSRALLDAIVASGVALAMLVVALLTAPTRVVRERSPAHARPAPIKHVEVQVHLEDARCVVEIHQMLRRTLEREPAPGPRCRCRSTGSWWASDSQPVAGLTHTRTSRGWQGMQRINPLWSSRWAYATVSANSNQLSSVAR